MVAMTPDLKPRSAGDAAAGRLPSGTRDADGRPAAAITEVMITTDELRRVLGPLGIWMPPPAAIGVDPESYARDIEAAGFTSVWYPGVNSPAALAAIEPVLAATQRLVLGTGIASVWTWEAADLAAAAVRLERLYPGRFVLGLGVSHAPAVEATGQAYVKPYTKMTRFLDELPDAGVPVVLAALGPKMLELSRDRTAGAHPYFAPPEHTAFARKVLGATPLLVPEIAVALTAGAAGMEHARDYAKFYLRLPNYTSNLRRFGYTDADIDNDGSDRLVSDVVPHGPEAARAGIAAHLAAGADHVLVQLIGPGGRFAAGDLTALAELTAGLR
jgi:probable F420-dependent oxidoreductase